MPKKRKTVKGKLNQIIDELIHPYFEKNPEAILLDGILHALVEQDPNQSIKKFIKYNLPKIIEQLLKEKQ